jgi:hypothetical protein
MDPDVSESELALSREREVSHALAYLLHEEPFVDIVVDYDGDVKVRHEPRRIRREIDAKLAAAGPAADFHRRLQTRFAGDADAAFADLIGMLHESAEVSAEDWERSVDGDDDAKYGAALSLVLAWSLAFHEQNRELVVEGAALLANSGDVVTYKVFEAQFAGRPKHPTEALFMKWWHLEEPHRDRIRSIEKMWRTYWSHDVAVGEDTLL